MQVKNLSVFFPLYNEEGNVRNSVEKAINVLNGLKIDYEILLVNDGSSDKTEEIANEFVKKNPKIRVINHLKNLGYGEALKSGFYNAKYDTIVYTDGDGQFDFSEIKKFLEKIEDHDLIIGYRIKRQDPFFRKLFKAGWKLSLLAFFGLTIKDVDCGFKMVKRSVLLKIPHLESARGAMINAELAIKAKKYGFKVGQVGVNHYPRLAGVPTGANLRVIVRSYIDLFKLWWKLKDQKLLFVVLIAVVLLASILRFYRLSEYMTFLGDEGRDAIVIKNMLINHHFPLIGPPTSVGNIYLGSLYYYMMALPMLIFWLNPVAAAAMDAFIGVLTVLLIYYLGKLWFGRMGGLISAYLYAISPVTIIYSRSSWNPNPAPFFALLAILGFDKAQRSGNFRWLILSGASVAGAVQMHYLALILIPIFGLLWLYELISISRNKLKKANFFSGTFAGIIVFFLLMSPLVIFDLRHDFMNFHAISKFFSNQESTVNFNPFNLFIRMPAIFMHNLIGRYIAGDMLWSNWLVSVLVLIPLVSIIYNKLKGGVLKWPFLVLGIWLFIGIAGLVLYQQTIYDHYLGFLNPVPFLLLGSLATLKLSNSLRGIFWGGIVFLLVVLTIVNLQKNPLLFSPNDQLKRTQEVAKFIIRQSENRDFNFALLAKNNYDSAYQFYLDLYGHKPKQVPFTVTDQLFVVCEDPECAPINNPKYEIAGFGWAKIENTQDFQGVKVLKLVHNPSGKPQ